jgi:glycosyltransferase involved in cell wall biosynthesis
MRVAVDARSLLCAEPRGEGKSLLTLYQHMTDCAPEVSVVFFGDEQAALYGGPLPLRTEVCLLPSRGMRLDLWQNMRLPFAARSFDVLHCTSSSAPLWTPVPAVMTVHDIIPLLGIDGHAIEAQTRFARGLARGMRYARSIIAVSGHTRSDLVHRFPGSEGRVHVVHWGSPRSCCPSPPATDPPYLLVFGGPSPRKNTAYTLERFAKAASRVADVQLEVVGVSDASYRDHLLVLAEQLGVADRVRVRGFVDEPWLAAALARSTALLYLSRYEGFGLPLLEAVALGTPVIASNSSSIPEVLGDPAGCFDLDDPVAIESAIARVATDPEERERRLHAQTRALARFDWNDAATRTLGLLKAAAQAKRVLNG